MFSKHFLLVFISILAFPVILPAQSINSNCKLSISGKISDDSTGEPLAFANIYIPQQDIGAVSDTLGNYKIDKVCPGTISIRVSHLGCEPLEVDIYVSTSLVQNFSLDHGSYELNQVLITGEKDRHQLNRITIKPAILERESGKSLGEIVRNIPGATSIRTGSTISKPVYHGLHSNRLLILNNGIRQEGQQWGGEHAPEIDPFLAASIQFADGVDALQYASDALGGVLSIEKPESLDRAGLEGKINLNGFSNNREGNVSLFLNGKIAEKFPLTYQLQGSLKKAGNARTPDYYLGNTGYEEYNYAYSLGWVKRNYGLEVFYSNFNQQLGIYRNAHIGNLTDLYYAINNIARYDTSEFSYEIKRPYQYIGHELFKTHAWLNTGRAGKLNLTLSRQYNQRREYDVHLGYNAQEKQDIPQLDYRLTTHMADLFWAQNQRNGFKALIGTSLSRRQNTTGGRDFLPNYEAFTTGAYFIESYQNSNWLLKAGLRYDFYHTTVYRLFEETNYSLYEFDDFAAGFSARYKLTAHLNVLADVSTLWRPPAINEQFASGIHHGTASIENGDPDLNSERIYSGSLALDYQKNNFLAFVRGFYNHINDYIYLDPAALELTISGAFPTFNYRQADARFLGADISVENEFANKFTAGVKGSVLFVSNVTENNFFTLMPAQEVEMRLQRSFAEFAFMQTPFISLNGSYTFRQYRAPEVLPLSFDNSIVQITHLPESFDFAAAPEGYFLLDAQVGFDFKLGKQIAKFSLVAENILNTRYRDYLNRMRYYADEPGFTLAFKLQIPLHIY